jgi:hypothetical protein
MRSSSPFLSSHAYEPQLQSQPQSQNGHTWFFRATAISASWLALAGYTLFSIIITAPNDNLRWSEDVLAALGGIALTSGYLGGLMALYFSHTLAFKLDAVILPLLLSSVGGLFELVLNYALHRNIPQDRAYIYAPLVAAALSTCVTAGAALFINTKIKIKQAVAESRRRHMELASATPGTTGTYFGWDSSAPTIAAPSLRQASASTPFLDHNGQPSPSPRLQHAQPYPPSTYTGAQHQPPGPPSNYTLQNMPMPPPLRHMSSTEIAPIEANIPEDEAQRRQLLRLLIAQEQRSPLDPSTGISPMHTGTSTHDTSTTKKPPSSTYRIDWPGSSDDDDDEDDDDDRGSTASLDPGRLGRHETPRTAAAAKPKAPPPTTATIQTSFPPPPTKETKQRHLHRRSASSAENGNRWSFGNLLGRRGRSPEPQADITPAHLIGGMGSGHQTQLRNRGESVQQQQQQGGGTSISTKEQKEQRERRRKEIERSSLSFASGGLEAGTMMVGAEAGAGAGAGGSGSGSVVGAADAAEGKGRGRSPVGPFGDA